MTPAADLGRGAVGRLAEAAGAGAAEHEHAGSRFTLSVRSEGGFEIVGGVDGGAWPSARASSGQEQPPTGPERQVRRARGLSAQSLEQARVLVPALPGIKRLQSIVYTQLQRSMLGQLSSDAALGEAAREWNLYSQARWP